MPELYAYEQIELDKARGCIVNGGRVILISLIILIIVVLVWNSALAAPSDCAVIYTVQESPVCQDIGSYTLYACPIVVDSPYHGQYSTIEFVSECTYLPPAQSQQLTFLPLVAQHQTIIGDPIRSNTR